MTGMPQNNKRNRWFWLICVSFLFLSIVFSLIIVNESAALSVSSSTANVTVGRSLQISITGGSGLYNISSSDPTIAEAFLSFSNTSTGCTGIIQGVANGTAIITVKDDTGGSETIDVTVSDITFDNNSVTLQPNDSEVVTILTSSTSPYTVTSSDDNIAEAVIASDQITITAISAGNASITVSNSNFNSAVIDVIVMPFYVSPSSVNISINEIVNCTISNSNEYYSASSSDTTIAIAAITGSSSAKIVSITGVSDGNAVITVEDSAQFAAAINVAVGAARTQTVTLVEGEQETISLSGGSGNYSANSADTSIATATVNNNNEVIVEGHSGGETIITITDNTGGSTWDISTTVRLRTPVLQFSVSSGSLQLFWDQITGADYYRLYVALPDASGANPDPATLYDVNIGQLTSQRFDVSSGDHYFASLRAYNSSNANITSEFSGVIEISIP